MTPEELKEFREWCKVYEMPANSWTVKALEHIDQQATSLDEAEALIKKNAELMNGYLARITELESQIIHQTGISACRIEERERMQKQIAALKEIAIGERAGFLHYRASCYDPGRRCPYAKGCDDCTGWDTCSALDRFNADAIRQLSEKHPEVFR